MSAPEHAATCEHRESLYGRCVACGMTWTEQATARRASQGSDGRVLELSVISTPVRDLPLGVVDDVGKVLAHHGLEAPVSVLVETLAEVIRRTPVERGGRLLRDGGVIR